MLRTLLLGAFVLMTTVACASGTDGAPATPSTSAPTEGLPQSPSNAEFRAGWPDPPQLDDNFTWSGRYVVADLGVEVPFTWQARGGDFQMIAGGANHPIHFTNIVHDGELFTLTYAWPDIPRQSCSHVGAFTIDELNAGFAAASFVGRETLHFEANTGAADYEVNHFRSVAVFDLPIGIPTDTDDELPLRVPLMAGDIYVDVDNPTQIRQLLHFGLQNLYDPNLDEWIVIDHASHEPGEVLVPEECTAQLTG